MKRIGWVTSLLGALVGLPVQGAAQGLNWSTAEVDRIMAQGRVSSVLDIDNDSLLLQYDDGFYTSGLRFSRSYRLQTDEGWRSAGWRVGQQIYTASDVRLRPNQIGALDHPYAGWLYWGFFRSIAHRDGSEAAVGLDIGCLGPCAGGEATQKTLHHVLKQPTPRAWSTQLHNEVGIVLHAGGRGPYWALSPSIDLRPGVAVRLGNIFTDLTVDATLRAGQLSAVATKSAGFGFVRLALRAVGYDASLQGGLFANETARTVKPERFTGEVELGMNWQHQQWGTRVSVIRRSNEIDGLAGAAGRQDFLRLSISYTP